MLRFLLFIAILSINLFASNKLFVETLDEQYYSKNLLSLRFRINNELYPIKDAVLKYCLVKEPGKEIVVERYYPRDAQVDIREVDSIHACIDYVLDSVPEGLFPNESGYSLGIRYENWLNRDKYRDFSMPKSSVFSVANNVALYADGMRVWGNVPDWAEPARYDAKILAFKPGDNGFIDIKNTGNKKILPESLFVQVSNGQYVRLLDCSLDPESKVRVYFDSLSQRTLLKESFEFLLQHGSMPVDYVVLGNKGILAGLAQENSLWDDRADFVKDYGAEFFYAREDLQANNSYAWRVYSEYEKDFYERYLPDALPYALPSGVRVVLENNRPMRFVWNRVPDAELYKLTVLSSVDSSVVYQNTYTTNAADVELATGDYLWTVQTSNSEKDFKPNPAPHTTLHEVSPVEIGGSSLARLRVLVQYINDELTYVENARIGAPFDTIAASNGRKDTRLLNISWGEFADIRGWDTIHLPPDIVTRPLDEDEGNRCWAIAIQELNHYYTTKDGVHGNLTLDEIIANVKMHVDTTNAMNQRKKPTYGPALGAFMLRENEGSDAYGIKYGLTFALKIPTPKNYSLKIEEWTDSTLAEKWKDMLRKDKPIYVVVPVVGGTHAMILDGYKTDNNGKMVFHFINTDNYGTCAWIDFSESGLVSNVEEFYEIDIPNDVALTDPDVHQDTDGDGIMDFDEKYRFHSRYDEPDSDGDSIGDKVEIHSYVVREIARHKSKGVLLNGVLSEKLADADGDGKRAENDDDSDGDGMKDEEEDVNHNGYVDEGETDPYSVDVWYPDSENVEKSVIPKEIALYALDFLRLNDGVKCQYGSTPAGCRIASEQKSRSAIVLGVKVSIVEIYSKGRVWLRNYAHADIIRYYGLPNYNFETDMQNGASYSKQYNMDASRWPWTIPDILVPRNESQQDKIVRSGESYTLQNGDSFKSLKVESGGKLYFSSGTMLIGNLQLDSKSEVYFNNPEYGTILHINESAKWNGVIRKEKSSLDDRVFASQIAQCFKLYYHGVETFDVAGLWCGTIVAPKAKIILGQGRYKEIYGQFLAKQIVVHQHSKIVHLIFDKPTIQPTIHQEVALGRSEL